MTGVVPVNPRFKFFHADGTPAALGWVTVYLAGTTTLATTYQDKALTTANTNPKQLDANGECLLWVNSTATYKILLQDVNLATVPGYPVDNIPGGADIGAAAAAAAEWATKTDGPVAGSLYSAKEYAQGVQASTGGSAKNWAQQTGADVTGASANSRSAKSWSQDVLTGATLGGSAKDWAQSANLPDGTSKSAKSYSIEAQTAKTAAETARDLAFGYAGAQKFATKALMDADLAHAAGTFAYVYADTVATNNGVYYKIGASGAGSWAVWMGDRQALIEALIGSDATLNNAVAVTRDENGNVLSRFDVDGGFVLGADATSVQKQLTDARRRAYAAAVMHMTTKTASNTTEYEDIYRQSEHADVTLGEDNPVQYQPVLMHDQATNVGYRIVNLCKVRENQILLVAMNTYIPNINTDNQNAQALALDLLWDPVSRTLKTQNPRVLVSVRHIPGAAPPQTARWSPLCLITVRTGPHAGRIMLFGVTNIDNPTTEFPIKCQKIYSDDGGVTWSAPVDMPEHDAAATGASGGAEIFQYSSGPAGIQLRHGTYAGRIVIPGYIFRLDGYGRFICVYSDDGGDTWTVGTRTTVESNETSIAEDIDGTIYASSRRPNNTRQRDMMKSVDGGATWTTVELAYVADSQTNGCIFQASSTAETGPKFITSNSRNATTRSDVWLGVSYGPPNEFDFEFQVDPSFAGYSAIEMFNEQDCLLVYESNDVYIDSTGTLFNPSSAQTAQKALVFNINSLR